MEPNESPFVAARRECAEECGISLVSACSHGYGQRCQVGKKQKATIYFPAQTLTPDFILSENLRSSRVAHR